MSIEERMEFDSDKIKWEGITDKAEKLRNDLREKFDVTTSYVPTTMRIYGLLWVIVKMLFMLLLDRGYKYDLGN